MSKRISVAIAAGSIVLFLFTSGRSQIVMENTPELQNIDVVEHLGEQIPLHLEFINSAGDTVSLQKYFKSGTPVLLTLAYYECPMLCTFVLNGLSKGVAKVAFLPGQDFQMLTVSIDPTETAQLAAAKKKNQVAAIGKAVDTTGWEFFVGEAANITELAESVGFKYYYDQQRDEYAHAAVSFILTGDGIISRYLYGIEYKEQDLRFALMEASEGRIGDTLDKFLLFCYHYDPDAKGYVIFAGNVMRIGGVITVLILGTVLLMLWRKENKKGLKLKTSG
jgi:protein SCO1/2